MQIRTPRPSRSQLLACAVALAGAAGLLGSVLAAHAEPPRGGGAATVNCVLVRTEAAFASVGYDHLVHLTNNCKRPVACTVTTSVNPEPANVSLGVKESTTLTTWRGSPAREFTADAKCQER
jgi:hypothetical protein